MPEPIKTPGTTVQQVGGEKIKASEAAEGLNLQAPDLQELSDKGGFLPVSDETPSIINQPETISQGSEQPREVSKQAEGMLETLPTTPLTHDDSIQLRTKTGKIINIRADEVNLGGFDKFDVIDEKGARARAQFAVEEEKKDEPKPGDVTTPVVDTEKKTLTDFMNDISSLTGLTDSEKQRVQAEVNSVSAEFDRIISKAERERARSLGISEVAAGEQGGFLSTQFAGAAAEPREISQRIFETRFGTGGELSRIKSEFDENISTLETKKVSAVQNARIAAEKAIKEGKVSDLELAFKMADEARAVEKEQREASEAFTEETRKQLKEFRDQLTFELDTTEQIRTQSVQQLKDFSDAGISPENISDEVKANLESKLNLPTGSFNEFFDKATKGELLSEPVAKSLGLSFGTTVEEAAELGIIPKGSDAENFDLRTVGNQVIRTDKTTGESEVIFEGSADNFANTFSFRKKFLDESKDFKQVRDAMGRIESAASRKSAAGDLALIFNFMKVLDPGSVVRESEFATAQNAAGVPERTRNAWNKLLYGTRLGDPSKKEKEMFGDLTREDAATEATEELKGQRKDFVDTARDLFNSQVEVQQARQNENRQTAKAFGFDPMVAVPDLVDPQKDIKRKIETVDLPNQSFETVQDFISSASVAQQDFIENLANKLGIQQEDEQGILDLITETTEQQEILREGGGTTIEEVSTVDGEQSVVEGISIKDINVKRTDRHNNPTAMTIAVAKQGGLIEGEDFIVGDEFRNNPNEKTAALIGDPIEKTIDVIDNISFFTAGGSPRWTHTQMSEEEWNALDRAGKVAVIKKMYQKEGNQGLLDTKFV